MKLRKEFTIGLVSLLGVTSLLGCKKKDTEVSVSKVEISGISTTYDEGAAIDWSGLKATATYSDGTTESLTKFEFDVEALAKTDTQAVVYTSGLYAQAEATKGTYEVSVALANKLDKKYSVGTIRVGKPTVDDNYALVSFAEPTIKTDYVKNIADAGTDIEPERNNKEVAKANENKFVSSDTKYVVGTMNPFVYDPEVMFLNLLDPEAEPVSGDDVDYEKVFEVKTLVGTEYVAASTSDYEIVRGAVQFKESAIGKTFSLKMKIKGFDTVYQTTTKAESTFEGFTVQKGLNIYDEKELGILNISGKTEEQLNAESYVLHHNDSDNVCFDGHDYYRPKYQTIWRNFLLEKHVYSEAQLTAYAGAPAFFLHKAMELTPSDIPSEYFISSAEFNGAHTGDLRDGLTFYTPVIGATDVEINGNFFSFDTTGIPLCKNISTDKGPHPWASTENIQVGHSTVIRFCGKETGNYGPDHIKTSEGQGIVRNVNTIGNAGADMSAGDFDKMLTLTGLIFANNDFCGATYDNVIVKQYIIAIFGNHMVGQAWIDDDTAFHSQYDSTFIQNCRIYDCANTGIFNYCNGGIKVSKSVLNRFGGSAMMNAGSSESDYAANTKVDADVIFNNEITGEEIYFTALGMNDKVGIIKGLNDYLSDVTDHFLYQVKDKSGKDIDVMNLVSMSLNCDGYGEAETDQFYCTTILNNGEENVLNSHVADLNVRSNQWGYYHDLRQGFHDNLHDQLEAAYEGGKRPAAIKYLVDEQHVPQEAITEEMVLQVLASSDFQQGYEEGFKNAMEEKFGQGFYWSQFEYVFNNVIAPESALPPGQKVPTFQTEVAEEFFWAIPKGMGENPGLYSEIPSIKYTAKLTGEYLSILFPLPGTATCLSMIFRIA